MTILTKAQAVAEMNSNYKNMPASGTGTAIETQGYDTVYGKLLGKKIDPVKAKLLSKIIIDISKTTGTSTDVLLRNVTSDGIRFDSDIYKSLNSIRDNSSQIGYIDIENIPRKIKSQII